MGIKRVWRLSDIIFHWTVRWDWLGDGLCVGNQLYWSKGWHWIIRMTQTSALNGIAICHDVISSRPVMTNTQTYPTFYSGLKCKNYWNISHVKRWPFFHFLRKCRRTGGLLWSWSNRTEALTSNNCIAPYSVWLVVVPWLSGYNGDYIVIVSSYPSPLIEIIKSCTTPPPTHCCQEVNSGIIHKLWLLTN